MYGQLTHMDPDNITKTMPSFKIECKNVQNLGETVFVFQGRNTTLCSIFFKLTYPNKLNDG
jgi:hypothetical protein